MSYRIGQGYDVHQLIHNSPFILGGVKIDCTNKGIKAHSDGDVLIHAIIDSLLGAINEQDLGHHFPNTEEWKKVSGLKMLDKINNLLKQKKVTIMNIDATIILQEPKLFNYINLMKSNISNILNISTNQISIKATTTDKLGFIGEGSGIAVQAVCLIHYG